MPEFRHSIATATTIAIAILTACSADPPAFEGRLLDKPQPSDAERLARLQRIHVMYPNPTGPSTAHEWTFADLEEAVYGSACYVTNVTGTLPGDACTSLTGGIVRDLCAANYYMELAQLRASTVSIPTANGTVQIGAQSSATNSLIAQGAAWRATSALKKSEEALRAASGLPYGESTCTLTRAAETIESYQMPNYGLPVATVLPGQTFAQLWSGSFVESYHLYKEAVALAVEEISAVADWQLTTTPSPGQQNARHVSGDALSRVAAAHLLVGGDPGLKGNPELGFCALPEPARGVATALDILRKAAVSPADVMNETLSTADLVDSSDDCDSGVCVDDEIPPQFSVRERLGQFWNYEPLRDGSSVTAFEYFGVSLADFAEAREHLREEIRVFDRSWQAKLPAQPIAGSLVTTIPAYAATGTAPPQRPDSFWSAVARFTSGPDVSTYTDGYPDYGIPGEPQNQGVVDYQPDPKFLGAFIDYAVTTADRLLSAQGLSASEATKSQLFDPLALLATDGHGERPGRLELHAFSAGEIWSGLLQGYSTSDKARLVLDEDALTCAIEGAIEGAPCTAADIVSATIITFDNTQTPGVGFTTAASGGYERPTPDDISTHMFYLIRLKEPGLDEAPGNYEVLSSIQPHWAPDAYPLIVPIVPEAEKRAADLLKPNRRWCARSALNCANQDWDARVPLEDELSDDNDGVESSWKHYLTLADQSAQEADLLGEEVVNAGLDMDRAAESALEELQDVCGAAINHKKLMDLFAPQGTLTGLRSQITCATDNTCNADQSCLGGYCTIDPIKVAGKAYSDSTHFLHGDPDLARLLECVGEGTLVDFATPGSKPVCVWVLGSNLNTVCEGASKDNPCPTYATHNCTPGIDIEPPSGTYQVLPPITATLGYFDTSAEGNLPSALDSAQALRRLRFLKLDPNAQDERQTLLNQLRVSGLLHPDYLRQNAPAVSWEARFRDYSAVLIDHRDIFATGSPWTGGAKGWPCIQGGATCGDQVCDPGQQEDRVSCPADCECAPDEAGLLCTPPIDCTNPNQRALMNDRLARAVAALRIHSGELTAVPRFNPEYVNPLAGLKVPVKIVGSPWLQISDVSQHVMPEPVAGTITVKQQAYTSHVNSHDDCALCQSPMDTGCSRPPAGVFNWRPVDGPFLATVPTAGEIFVVDGPFAEAWRSPIAQGSTTLDSPLVATDPAVSGSGYWFGIVEISAKEECPFCPSMGPQIFGGLSDSTKYPRSKPDLGLLYDRLLTPTVEGTLCTPGGLCGVGLPESQSDWGTPSVNCFPAVGVPQRVIPRLIDNTDTLLDGLELYFAAYRERNGGDCGGSPPDVRVEGLSAAKNYLRCVADSLERRAGLNVFAKIPTRALDALRKDSKVGAFPAVGGLYGEALTELRGGLVGISELSPRIAEQIRGLGDDLEALQKQLDNAALSKDIASLNFMATVYDQMTKCANDLVPWTKVVTCAGALGQITFAGDLLKAQQQQAQNNSELATIDFRGRFADRSLALHGMATDFSRQVERIDGGLAELESLRQRGRRALAKAFWMDSADGGIQFSSNTVMRKRFNTKLVRYKQAHKSAVRMSFLAKRAIEQRLGIRLSEIRENLPLVEAPATWEASVCNLSGIDYAKLRDANPTRPQDYANEYIGDYVNRLRNVVESYRLAHNFHEGVDTAVVSLRDDVHGVRALCQTEVGNLLYQAGQLDVSVQNDATNSNIPTDARAWFTIGCNVDGSGTELPNCVRARPLDEKTSAGPFPASHPELSAVRGYRVFFGPGDGSACVVGACGYASGAGLAQGLNLGAGRYRLSYYARTGSVAAADAVSLIGLPISPAPVSTQSSIPPAIGTWERFYRDYDVSEPSDVAVIVTPASLGQLGYLDVAAIMLEDVTTIDADSSLEKFPRTFANTTDVRTRMLPRCEDSSGDVFRASKWRRNCVRLCSSGFSSECTDDAARTYCYRETEMTVAQRDLDSGAIFTQSGFARGNFNYRVESLGLNFVGTGLRDCSASDLPQTCAGAGYASYSIEHAGPYYVRNHAGQDFQVDLFTGNIEHARGLAAERYLTNPLSAADRSLIEPYLRNEFQGRPLDGTFVVRVWEEPGFNFDALQDIQVVLNYRYWTRFN